MVLITNSIKFQIQNKISNLILINSRNFQIIEESDTHLLPHCHPRIATHLYLTNKVEGKD